MDKTFKLKLVGEVLILIPIILLFILGLGEMSAGILSGVQHFIQVVPLIILAVVAWKNPKVGGSVLLGLGLILALVFPILMWQRFPAWMLLINDLILFSPPILAAILLLLSTI